MSSREYVPGIDQGSFIENVNTIRRHLYIDYLLILRSIYLLLLSVMSHYALCGNIVGMFANNESNIQIEEAKGNNNKILQ